MELPVRFGKYLLEESIDDGEAATYRALDTETGRTVMVKVQTDEWGDPVEATETALAAPPGLRIVSRKPVRPGGSGFRWKWAVAGAAVAAALALVVVAAVHFWPKPNAAPAAAIASAATILTPSGAMVLVPAGAFLFGEARQQAWMPAFYIDKTEVTNADYAAFCKASAHPLPPDFPPEEPDYPVVNVSMLDAKAFAAWAGQRIPSGREWEKAARGDKGQAFPWGDQPDRSRTNIGLVTMLPADAFPKGASPYGALQMIGNAWEWVNDTRTPTPQELEDFAHRVNPPLASDELWYAVQGGGFDSPQLTPLLMWDAKTAPERWQSNDIGFRCVKDAR